MTGYESKRAMAQDKLAQPAAPEVWMFQHDETGRVTCILNDGINTPELFLEMNPRYALIGSPNSLKRPWVDLTPQDLNEIFAIARTGEHAVRLALDKLKEKNNE